jgi:serine/threonine-protein kinase HipA
MGAERRVVEVFADWAGLGGPVPMGELTATPSRGHDVLSFTFHHAWLDAGHVQPLDPSLRPLPGPQYPPAGRGAFGLFLDASPDRWGRVLLDRREALLAREQHRRPRALRDLDYLLGVFDGHRLGALRFRTDGGPFLDDNADLASPPWTSLGELERASLHLEQEGDDDDPVRARWLRMLIAPGRSLGGARPKASVRDGQGRLWIAKFPSARDTFDVGAWEGVLHALATRAGVVVPEGTCRRFGAKHHTFLSRRFDRDDDGVRRHFASAMTLLERTDGDEGASYLELAQALMQGGARATKELEQLWRRIVFSMCVSNVDDHLRNHGFLLERDGWSLAPAYDMNPVATGDGLCLNISETDNAQDLGLARDVARHFRVTGARGDAIIDEVVRAVREWPTEGRRVGLPREELDRMADAFRLCT